MANKKNKKQSPKKEEKVVYYGSIRSLVNAARRRALQPGTTYAYNK